MTERLAHHATVLLLERGAQSVTMLDVVQAAAVSKAAAYRRWSNLTALWVDLIGAVSAVDGPALAGGCRVHPLIELWTGQLRRDEAIIAEFVGATHLEPPVVTALHERLATDLAAVLRLAREDDSHDRALAPATPVERLARALLVARLLCGPQQPAAVRFLCDLARRPEG